MSNPCPSPENVPGFVVGEDVFITNAEDGRCRVMCFCGALILPERFEKHKTYTTHKENAREKWARIGQIDRGQIGRQRLANARQECVDAKNALRSKYERRLANSNEKYRTMVDKFKDAKRGETASNLAHISERATSQDLRRDLQDCEERERQRNQVVQQRQEQRQEQPQEQRQRHPLLGAIEGGAQLRQVGEQPPRQLPRRAPLLDAIEGGAQLRKVGEQPPRQRQGNPLLDAIKEGVQLKPHQGQPPRQLPPREDNAALVEIVARRGAVAPEDDESDDESDDDEWKFRARRKSKKSVRKSVRKTKKSVRKTKKSVRKTKKSVRKTKKSVRKTKKSVRKSVRNTKSKKSVRRHKK